MLCAQPTHDNDNDDDKVAFSIIMFSDVSNFLGEWNPNDNIDIHISSYNFWTHRIQMNPPYYK